MNLASIGGFFSWLLEVTDCVLGAFDGGKGAIIPGGGWSW